MIITKSDGDIIYFFCVKRCEKDGGYWNLIVGTQEVGETDSMTIKREIFEELNLNLENINIIPNCLFNWRKDETTVLEKSYILHDIDTNQLEKIKLNEEHTEFKWCKYEEAYKLLEKTNNKKCLALAKNKLFQLFSFQNFPYN